MPESRLQPQAVDIHSSVAGLRAIASLEAIKGGAVLLLMCVLLLVHSHMDELAENLLYHLHMDPDKRIGQAFLHAAYRLGDLRLLTIVAAAVSYSTVRFVESWGLWHRRVWAEWFALLSGAIYLPWELARLIERPSLLHATILVANLVIVAYMLWVRIKSTRPRYAQPVLQEPTPR